MVPFSPTFHSFQVNTCDRTKTCKTRLSQHLHLTAHHAGGYLQASANTITPLLSSSLANSSQSSPQCITRRLHPSYRPHPATSGIARRFLSRRSHSTGACSATFEDTEIPGEPPQPRGRKRKPGPEKGSLSERQHRTSLPADTLAAAYNRLARKNLTELNKLNRWKESEAIDIMSEKGRSRYDAL